LEECLLEKRTSMKTFGEYIRERRESFDAQRLRHPGGHGRRFSLRALALAVGVQPSHLSNVELGLVSPSQDLVKKLADALNEDVDLLMALAGKISPDLEAIIRKRPQLFGCKRSIIDVYPTVL
jgi:transcriptional regulator with XRE-family HTH domain